VFVLFTFLLRYFFVVVRDINHNEKKVNNSIVLKEKSDASKCPETKVARTKTANKNTEKDYSEGVS